LGGLEVTPVLLDTHVWIWWSIGASQSLSAMAQKALVSASKKWVSAISCWELAKLVEKNRLGLAIHPLTWIKRSLQEGNIRLADLTPEIAVESTRLSGFHADPADQIIVATARILELPLITSDKRILSYPDVETLW
jgi:PIN domain nuclease of toxin-antitoxin system